MNEYQVLLIKHNACTAFDFIIFHHAQKAILIVLIQRKHYIQSDLVVFASQIFSPEKSNGPGRMIKKPATHALFTLHCVKS